MGRHLFLIQLIVIVGLVFPVPAHAQSNGLNITTSPLPISIHGEPGSTLTTDIRVKNSGSTHEKLKVSLMKFSAYGEEGKPAILDRAPGDDYFDWVTFSPTVFDAPPNEWKTIKMTIKLPSTAAYGYYYAAAFSRADMPNSSGKQNILFGSTAVLVLVEARVPNAKRQAKLVNFSVNRSSTEFLPVTFKIRLHNSGNIHIVPSGTLEISQGAKKVSEIIVNPEGGNILPGTNRVYTAHWDTGFPLYVQKEENGKIVLGKDGKQAYDLKWDLGKIQQLRIGRYTAHLLLIYDDGTKDVPLEAYVSFWVMPWRLIGVGSLVTLFVGIGLWSSGRNIYRKVRKK